MKVATDVRNMKPYLYDLSNGMVKFGKDYTFINANNEQAVKCAIGLYQKLLSQYVPEDILVLSAFNKGDCGTIAINNAIQKIANPNYGSEKCIKSGDTTYYVGDIVIQIKNNYEAELKKAKEDLYRGFPISEKEQEKIREWELKHDAEKHGLKTMEQRLRAGGCCGGRYTYQFVPTSIGTVGEVICSCGEKFTFQDL